MSNTDEDIGKHVHHCGVQALPSLFCLELLVCSVPIGQVQIQISSVVFRN